MLSHSWSEDSRYLHHEPGEELQLDWPELSNTPWGAKAQVLAGALSHSGRPRGCFSGIGRSRTGSRRSMACYGGSARSWQVDRPPTIDEMRACASSSTADSRFACASDSPRELPR